MTNPASQEANQQRADLVELCGEAGIQDHLRPIVSGQRPRPWWRRRPRHRALDVRPGSGGGLPWWR